MNIAKSAEFVLPAEEVAALTAARAPQTVADEVLHLLNGTPVKVTIADDTAEPEEFEEVEDDDAASTIDTLLLAQIVAFTEALNDESETNAAIALTRIKLIDETVATALRPQYFALIDKKNGWTRMYQSFQKACNDKNQAQATGYLKHLIQKFGTTYPKRIAKVRGQFSVVFLVAQPVDKSALETPQK